MAKVRPGGPSPRSPGSSGATYNKGRRSFWWARDLWKQAVLAHQEGGLGGRQAELCIASRPVMLKAFVLGPLYGVKSQGGYICCCLVCWKLNVRIFKI